MAVASMAFVPVLGSLLALLKLASSTSIPDLQRGGTEELACHILTCGSTLAGVEDGRCLEKVDYGIQL